MSRPPFTLALCEGFHDRAFLSGVLVERLGWRAPGLDDAGRRVEFMDAWGKVAGGDFGFVHAETGAQLRLRPCHGHAKIPDQVKLALKNRSTRSFDRLLINYDGDKGGDGPDFVERIHQSVTDMLSRCGAPPESRSDGRLLIDGGAREIRVLIWQCDDPAKVGVPEQQCLERLVCAAAGTVWPERIESIGSWVGGRPTPSVVLSHNDARTTIAKTYGWALMAGYGADHGCDDFLSQVWRDESFAQALRSRLTRSGAWEALESCKTAPAKPAS